ncbi:MAG: DUF4422 domain-containing protein [Lachnospiraceae bacterium]|nr:DUF4422 domain-containing protein [Lachnospiraceae bacterium]
MNSTVEIYVSNRVDLKNRYHLKNKIYIPIRCGAVDDADNFENIAGDDTGDNISNKAKYYSELSVQYWAWKNSDAQYVGLCHYRRFLDIFCKSNVLVNEYGLRQLPYLNEHTVKLLGLDDPKTLQEEIMEYDLIINESYKTERIATQNGIGARSVRELWEKESRFIPTFLLDRVLELIKEKRPDVYNSAKLYLNGDKHRGYNCFIMRRDIFAKLNEFQFNILGDIEKEILNTEYIEEQPRCLAYIGELLYGIYMHYEILNNNYKIKEVPLILMVNTQNDFEENNNIKFEILKSDCWIILKRICNIIIPFGTKRRNLIKKIYIKIKGEKK